MQLTDLYCVFFVTTYIVSAYGYILNIYLFYHLFTFILFYFLIKFDATNSYWKTLSSALDIMLCGRELVESFINIKQQKTSRNFFDFWNVDLYMWYFFSLVVNKLFEKVLHWQCRCVLSAYFLVFYVESFVSGLSF